MKSILIVEDDAPTRCLIARWLRTAGFACDEASNAAEAMIYLQSHHVDLVTCDMRMPGRSGAELQKDVCLRWPDVPFIMLTGHGEASTAIESLTAGAAGYLIKPVQREELLFQVDRALERQQLLAEKRHYTQQLEQKVHEQTLEIRAAHEETIHRLMTATMYRDEETGAHIRRTGLFSALLARASGWSESEADQIRLAAPMHDVGKIAIPDAILRKPGQLTEQEFAVMKEHTVIGARMLEGSSSKVLDLARVIALQHHERWDGSGYPFGRSAGSISDAARIVAIVDVYDAITHDRVYRSAMSREQAVAVMMSGQGTHFDPVLLTTFMAILEEVEDISRDHPDGPDDIYTTLPGAAYDARSMASTR